MGGIKEAYEASAMCEIVSSGSVRLTLVVIVHQIILPRYYRFEIVILLSNLLLLSTLFRDAKTGGMHLDF